MLAESINHAEGKGQTKGFAEMAEEEEKRAQARAAANLLEDIDYVELDSLIDRASENIVGVLAVPAVQAVCDFSTEPLEEGQYFLSFFFFFLFVFFFFFKKWFSSDCRS